MSLLFVLIVMRTAPFSIESIGRMFGPYNDFLLLAFVGYGLGNKYISLNSKWSVFVVFCLWQLSIFAIIFSKNDNPFSVFSLSSIMCLFLLVKAVPELKVPILIKKSISFIAKYSLPIYGWHALFLTPSINIAKEYSHSLYLSIFISFFSVLGLSLACGIITSKILSTLFKRKIII